MKPESQSTLPAPRRESGSALLIILALIGIGAAFLLVSALMSNPQIGRDKITAAALAQAKDALIGYAVTYRDKGHPDDVFGYLPCPDVNNDGAADTNQGGTNCAGKDIPVVGRLPWKTLGLPPLRDSHGECLWYAVSGTFKAVAGGNLTDFMNWDTLGQFAIQDAGGTLIAGATNHNRPVAVIFSPGPSLNTQNRPPSSGQECSGDTNNTVAAYLDVGNAFTIPAATPVMLTAGTYGNTTINDRLLWISPDEIFKRIKQRNDFKLPALPVNPNGDVNNLLTSVAACLNAQTTLPEPKTIDFSSTTMPLAETSGLTVGGIVAGRVPQNYVNTNCSTATATETLAWRTAWNGWWNNSTTYTGKNFYTNWQDNLLYAKCSSGQCLTVNGSPCAAVLIFSGERDATASPAQNRATAANKNIWSNYLEGNSLGLFNSGAPTTISSVPTTFSIVNVNTAATADIVVCINSASPSPPSPIVGGTPITLNATTITAACSGVCAGSGINTGVTTLTLAGPPALTITATGGTIGRNQGGASTDAIGVYQGGGAGNTALQAGETLSFRLTGNTAQKFGITLYGFSAGEQALLTFKNSGTTLATYTATTATAANINPGSVFDEVVVQAVGTSAFWVQTVKFCDAATSC